MAKEMDKLSRDMIQCKKDGFGCHYGAWRAAQETAQIIREPEQRAVVRRGVCLNCGEEFDMYDNRIRKHCCESCQNQYYRRMKRKRMSKEKDDGQAEPVTDTHEKGTEAC